APPPPAGEGEGTHPPAPRPRDAPPPPTTPPAPGAPPPPPPGGGGGGGGGPILATRPIRAGPSTRRRREPRPLTSILSPQGRGSKPEMQKPRGSLRGLCRQP
ncbi:hypothetical protein BV497_16035, partial [Fulvimonas soli]